MFTPVFKMQELKNIEFNGSSMFNNTATLILGGKFNYSGNFFSLFFGIKKITISLCVYFLKKF